jgi:acyl-CoA dehydrogenase
MRFELTDDQRALADSVRTYLRDSFGPQQVREHYADEHSDGVPAWLWQAVAEQGWLAVLVPEEHDGVGLGLLEASLVARAFGASSVPGPWLGSVLAAEALRLGGSPLQQKALLPGLATGEIKGAVALPQTGAAKDVLATARAGRLSGELGLVDYAAVADILLVAAQDGLYVVDPAVATITPQTTLDRTTRLTLVVLDDAPGERLDEATTETLQELLERAAVLAANDLVGIARKALTETIEYDKARVQFGKPVGSFQAIKHDLADIHMAVTMAEHAALYAAHAFDVADPDRHLVASIAKAKSGDAASRATSAMIQYHGGIGYTWEHQSHVHLKRAKRFEYQYGDAAQHRERVAHLLIDVA